MPGSRQRHPGTDQRGTQGLPSAPVVSVTGAAERTERRLPGLVETLFVCREGRQTLCRASHGCFAGPRHSREEVRHAWRQFPAG